ncbi:MAG: hypothetical protein WKG07_08935 [Hymenobacter sp.]
MQRLDLKTAPLPKSSAPSRFSSSKLPQSPARRGAGNPHQGGNGGEPRPRVTSAADSPRTMDSSDDPNDRDEADADDPDAESDSDE